MTNLFSAVSTEGSKKPDGKVRRWLSELDEADKREKDWRKEATKLVDLFECEDRKENQFNILYSNTETLAPVLYNNLPRPVVQRRHRDDNPLGQIAAKVAQRTLEFLLDNDIDSYTPFDKLMEQAVLEALVPGRGVVRYKYDATFDEAGTVTYETVCGEVVPWDRFYHGYAKQWKDVPWIAFEHFMTREELERNFPETGKDIPLSVTSAASEAQDEDERGMGGEDSTPSLGHVFEVWDKETKTVYFVAPALPEQFVKVVEDPLSLSGFFPLPQPLAFFPKIRSLVPATLYSAYEEQAKELNRVTVRINKIIAALKVRGFYDSTIEGLDKVFEAADNTLVPAENVAALQQGQSLEKAIWLMPLEKLIAVLQQLYLQRQQIKQVIYEITGISDILRGASVASETATAQNIKNQWGTLRLKRWQKITSIFARNGLRIMAEIAFTKFSQPTIAAMVNMQFPSAEQKQQAQALLGQIQAQGAQLPPEMQQQLAQLQGIAASPSWEEILGELSSDLQRAYSIDVETNSTVDAEATEDKQNISEFLNAIAQYLNGIAPMVQQNIMPFDAAKAILLAVTRRYRFGLDVEDEIRKMQAPQQPQMPPEIQKKMEEVGKAEEQLQKDAADLEAAKREFEQEKEFALREIEMTKQMALKELEFESKEKDLELNLAGKELEHGLALKQAAIGEQEKKAAEASQVREKEKGESGEAAALQETRQALTSFVETLAKMQSTPKRARKLPDGTWETF